MAASIGYRNSYVFMHIIIGPCRKFLKTYIMYESGLICRGFESIYLSSDAVMLNQRTRTTLTFIALTEIV